VLRDTIQPFPTFSEAFLHGLTALTASVNGNHPVGDVTVRTTA
jgi:hypothetical protein